MSHFHWHGGERTAFHDWLSQRQDRIVGRPYRSASCPLATWLRWANKNRRLHVSFASATRMAVFDPNEPSGQFDFLPSWCEVFVEAFDTLVERGPTQGHVALAVLDELETGRAFHTPGPA